MRHQALQTLAAGQGQVFGKRQGQPEIQAGKRRAQFMGDSIEQVALLVQEMLDIVGHGVEHRRQAADAGAGCKPRTGLQVALTQ